MFRQKEGRNLALLIYGGLVQVSVQRLLLLHSETSSRRLVVVCSQPRVAHLRLVVQVEGAVERGFCNIRRPIFIWFVQDIATDIRCSPKLNRSLY